MGKRWKRLYRRQHHHRHSYGACPRPTGRRSEFVICVVWYLFSFCLCISLIFSLLTLTVIPLFFLAFHALCKVTTKTWYIRYDGFFARIDTNEVSFFFICIRLCKIALDVVMWLSFGDLWSAATFLAKNRLFSRYFGAHQQIPRWNLRGTGALKVCVEHFGEKLLFSFRTLLICAPRNISACGFNGISSNKSTGNYFRRSQFESEIPLYHTYFSPQNFLHAQP